MKYTNKIVAFFAAGFFLFNSAMAADDEQQKDYDQGHAVQEHQILGGYNAPARFDTTGDFDMFITGSFIYWYAKEGGLDFAYMTPTTPNNHNGYFVYPNFKYEPGFKVGIGTNLDHDNWDAYTQFTRLLFSNSKTVTPDANGTLIPTWSESRAISDINRWAKTKWKLNFNTIDLEFARAFYCGSKLTYRPHFGLKGGWINQRFNNTYAITYQATDYDLESKSKSKTWLIGPRAGVNAGYILGAGFRVVGNSALSIFYQRFKTKHTEVTTTTYPSLATYIKDKHGLVNPALELGAGAAWGWYFFNKQTHLDISALYDFVYFWRQNMMRYIVDKSKTANALDNKNDSLNMHGLTVNVRIDF